MYPVYLTILQFFSLSNLDGIRVSADQMDEKRQEKIAYEYLCHLEETKTWIEMCIREPLPQSIDLEEALRNGVFLAKLAHRFQPQSVPMKKIYDVDQTRYKEGGLTFRHTDNINHWLSAMSSLGLPAIFLPETTVDKFIFIISVIAFTNCSLFQKK